jgi:pimeloyl-ACP methyl ester carboxylesterase
MLKTSTFRGETITYSDTGKGRVVILLHGFLGSHEIWQPIHDNLAKYFRVIAIDLPGHGKTACFGYVHSMDLMAKCVKSVMDNLRLKKYVIVGHSMGGYVALAFGELFPDNLRGLCLFHSTAYPDSDQKKRDRSRAIKLVKANARLYTRDTIKNLFATKNLDRFKSEVTFAQKIAFKTPKRGIVAALEGMKDRPNRDVILNFAEYPVMMIIGRYDNILPMQLLLNQSQLIKQKHILLLENEGHMGFLEAPKICLTHLKRFARVCFSARRKTSK